MSSRIDDVMCDGEYHASVGRNKTVFSLKARISIIKDFLSKLAKFDSVFMPTCQIKTGKGLSAEDVMGLLKVIYANKSIVFIPCDDGCDDVCIKGGGRVYLYRECPDCGGKLIHDNYLTNIPLNIGIAYSCPKDPLTYYRFVSGKLEKIS